MKFILRLALLGICLLFLQPKILFSQFDVEWYKFYGGNKDDVVVEAIQTIDGGIVVTGVTESNEGDFGQNNGMLDTYILKVNQDGELLWSKIIGGTENDYPTGIAEDSNGNLYVLLFTDSTDGLFAENYGSVDAWIYKLDPNGNLVSFNNYGGSGPEINGNISINDEDHVILTVQTASSDVDISVEVMSNSGFNLWMAEINQSGTLIWNDIIENSTNISANKHLFHDNSLFVIGSTMATDFDFEGIGSSISVDYYLFEFSQNDGLNWLIKRGGSEFDSAKSFLVNTQEEIVVIAGITYSGDGDFDSNNGNKDAFVAVTDFVGEQIWSQTFGGSEDDDLVEIINYQDGYLLGINTTSTDFDVMSTLPGTFGWLIHIDKDGEIIWDYAVGGEGRDELQDILVVDDQFLYAFFSSNTFPLDPDSHHGADDVLVAKYSIPSVNVVDQNNDNDTRVFPNPASRFLHIEVDQEYVGESYSLSTIEGKVIQSSILSALDTNIDVTDLFSGLYILNISTEHNCFSQKIVIE